MEPVNIGVIGCGVISEAYLRGAARSSLIKVKALADMKPEAAAARAAQFGLATASVDALLADPEISIVLNLTVPLAHAAVNRAIVSAGKSAYAEKPLCATHAEATALLAAAAARGVRVGGAPDTFLGASHQACRRAIDAGRIGKVISGSASVQGHGMEHWHPQPHFYFARGGGPVLDMGPYYLTQLVNLLGPVASVAADTSIGNATRTITSEPRAGEVITVEVQTTASALIRFESGACITFAASWDVWKNRRLPFELHGVDGSLLVPDPNFFGDAPEISEKGQDWVSLDYSAHPFGAPTRATRTGQQVADYRIIGLLDMAAAIRLNRPHRASGALAAHVVEVLEAIGVAGAERRWVDVVSRCERPAPLPLGADEQVFLQ